MKRRIVAVIIFLLLSHIGGSSLKAEQLAREANADITPAPIQSAGSGADFSAMHSARPPIPIAEVQFQATMVTSLLDTVAGQLTTRTRIDKFMRSLSDAAVQVGKDIEKTMDVLATQPTLLKLKVEHQQWQNMQFVFAEWLEILTEESQKLQGKADKIDDLQEIWVTTLSNANKTVAPSHILQQINDTITAIRSVEDLLKEYQTQIWNLQNQVRNEVTKCKTVLIQISLMQQALMSKVLEQNSEPVWDSSLWTDARKTLPLHIGRAAASFRMDIGRYFMAPYIHLVVHAVIFVVLGFLFLAVRNLISRGIASGETYSSFTRIFEHPIAAALTLVLIAVTAPYRSMLPVEVRETYQVLALVPMIIVVRPFVSEQFCSWLYALVLLFSFDSIRVIFFSEELSGQVFLVIESLTGMVVMLWCLRNLRDAYHNENKPSILPAVKFGTLFVFLLLTFGFVAAAIGYVRIVSIITPTLIAGGVMALSMYATLNILIGIVSISFYFWPLRLLSMIQHHRHMLEGRIYRLLWWAATAGFIARYFDYIGILDLVLSFFQTVLTANFELSTFSISAADVIEFLLIIWAANLLSAVIRFVLHEDIYPRLVITKGKSFVVSSFFHYLIIALGFTAAITALGVDLSKLTLLTGALGIGIGFGLQNVVNNFVSGLILLLEQPIQVGDTVQVDDLAGKVRKIGIRASTVHTRQGSEIIIPNAQLVTEKVTNWTFSDQMKRINLPVGVSYSAAPESVMALLESVAHQNSRVLQTPPPCGLFVGFGDSSINFELRAWTEYIDDWPIVRSELATAIYDAVLAAGMTFPFPQREVRLLKDSTDDIVKSSAIKGNK